MRSILFTRRSLGVGGFTPPAQSITRSLGVGGFTPPAQSITRSLGVGGFLLTLFATLFSVTAFAQNPIKWAFTAKDAGNCQLDLIFTGTLNEGWYTYSQFLESEEGPVATLITFQEGANFKLIGKAAESGEIIKVHDPIFDMNLTKFKHIAILTQRVEVKDPGKPVAGYITYMTCNDEMCLPPKDVDFSFKIPALAGCSANH